jgi:hypothetical protein
MLVAMSQQDSVGMCARAGGYPSDKMGGEGRRRFPVRFLIGLR